MAKFQVKLGGDWKDYNDADDKVLKQASASVSPSATLMWKGHTYVCDLRKMLQVNQESGKEHRIRPPFKPKASVKPRKPTGPTTVVNVPPGAPGTTIQVPHPRVKGAFLSVNVPASAKVGQAMLVPVPEHADALATPPSKDKPGTTPSSRIKVESDDAPAEGRPAETPQESIPAKEVSGHKASGAAWSTGCKIGAGLGIGGVAVAGAILGCHLADGSDATGDAVADGGADTLEATDDVMVDTSELVVDAGEDMTDSVLDLF